MYLDLTAPNQNQTGFLQTCAWHDGYIYIYVCVCVCISLDDDVISFVRDGFFNKTFDYNLKGCLWATIRSNIGVAACRVMDCQLDFLSHMQVNQCLTYVSKIQLNQLNHACLALVLLLVENLNYGLCDWQECTVTRKSKHDYSK